MPKGDRVYAGTDEDARWIPEGAALAAYLEKKREQEKMPAKGWDKPVVAKMSTVEPKEDAPPAVVKLETVEVEGDDAEASPPLEVAGPAEDAAPPSDPAPEKIFSVLTKEFGECPQCKTPSSRIISTSEEGKNQLQCASGHSWTA